MNVNWLKLECQMNFQKEPGAVREILINQNHIASVAPYITKAPYTGFWVMLRMADGHSWIARGSVDDFVAVLRDMGR